MTFPGWVGNLSEWLGVIAVVMILGLSPSFKRREIRFQYKSREIKLSLILFGVILIWSVLAHTGAIPLGESTPDYLDKSLWLRFLVACVSVLPFAAALYIRKQPLLSIGWAKSLLSPGLQMGFALAIITIFLRNKITLLTNGFTTDEVNTLMLCAGISLAEESIFRGYLQTRLESIWGKNAGWLATAGIYFLFQLPRFLANPASLPLNLLLVAIQGVLLGWIMRKSGHVLAPALYRIISEWVIFLV